MSLSDFIDIHTHILPGLDDGPRNMDESLLMAKWYSNIGIKTIIATPHYIHGTAWVSTREQIREEVNRLQEQISIKKISLTVLPGMEIALNNQLKITFDDSILTPLGRSGYFLLEPSFYDPPQNLFELIDSMAAHKRNIVLAHPERASFCQKSPQIIPELVKRGVKIQLNLGSLLGRFGNVCKKTALHLIASHCVHYIASDAHSTSDRTPPTEADWKDLIEILNTEVVTKLCIINPGKLIYGA